MRNALLITCIGTAILAVACSQDTPQASVPTESEVRRLALARAAGAADEAIGDIEVAALFRGPMPTGVAISKQNRLFVCIPRWGDPVEFTVAEVRNGRTVPFP